MEQHSCELDLPLGPLTQGPHIALDMGGSLIKVAYTLTKDKECSQSIVKVHCKSFLVSEIEAVLEYLDKEVIGVRNGHMIQVAATGVGSFKYYNLIKERLNVTLNNDSQELVHAAHGLDMLWRVLPKTSLLENSNSSPELRQQCSLRDSGLGTFALASIGSALVLAEVDVDKNIHYIGGNITAGHTFCGLGRLLTGKSEFSQLVNSAQAGDRSKVDLYVQDTAGTSYNMAQPEADVSSFGQMATCQDMPDHTPADVAASLMYNVCDQIGTTSFLICHSRHLQNRIDAKPGLSHVLFCGSFLNNNSSAKEILVKKLEACSLYLQYSLKPLFLHHTQYLSVLGVLQSLCQK